MVNLVEIAGAVYVGRYVVVDVLELCLVLQTGNVLQRAGPQMVHADHPVVLREEPIAEMAPEESGPARYQRLMLFSLSHAQSPYSECRRPSPRKGRERCGRPP